MQQLSFTDAEEIHKKRKTRRKRFLERMDKLMPWTKLEALIQPSFRYVKQVFSYSKTRYRGLKKNTARIYMLLAFANLLIMEKHCPA